MFEIYNLWCMKKRIYLYLSRAYQVFDGQKPWAVVAQLPKDIIVRREFFKHIEKRHPEIDKNKLFAFVRTLNFPDEIYQLKQKDKFNFLRKLENNFINVVGILDQKKRQVVTSFFTNKKNYIRNIKKTSREVFFESFRRTPRPPSMMQSPPAGEVISGVKTSTNSVRQNIKKSSRKLLFFLLVIIFYLSIFSPASAKVILTELYPAPPTGSSEAIEIFNDSTDQIDLTGFIVEDKLSSPSVIYRFADGNKLGGQSYLSININSKLNNSGDGVVLKNNLGEILDQVDYGASESELSWTLSADKWQWQVPSLGVANPTIVLATPTPSPITNSSPSPLSNLPSPLPSPSANPELKITNFYGSNYTQNLNLNNDQPISPRGRSPFGGNQSTIHWGLARKAAPTAIVFAILTCILLLVNAWWVFYEKKD